MVHEITKRPVTHDIDVLFMDRRLAEIISHYPEVNGAMSAFLNCIPYNYEDRLIELPLVTNAITYYTPSLEDLAIMKLYAWRPNDISDLTSKEFLDRVDWDILHRLIFDPEEARAFSHQIDYMESSSLHIKSLERSTARNEPHVSRLFEKLLPRA